MGTIEFLGFLDDTFTFGNVEVPENAREFLGKFDNSNILNWMLFSLPIIAIFAIMGIVWQRKVGILNKENRKKEKERIINKYNLVTPSKKIWFGIKQFLKIYVFFYIMIILITAIHELIHALVGMVFGGDMKVAIIPGGAVTITSSPMTRTQYLYMLLTPVISMGIIPSIVLAIQYLKIKTCSFKKAFTLWFCMFIFLGMTFSASPDIVSTYNILNEVPKDAMMQQTDSAMYWYQK